MILRHASKRSSGTWGPDDYDVIHDGREYWAHLQTAGGRATRSPVDVDDHRGDADAGTSVAWLLCHLGRGQGEIGPDTARHAWCSSCAGARLGYCNYSARNLNARQHDRSLARSRIARAVHSPIPTSRDLLRLVDRIFRSRFLRSGLLPWHYSRIRNHFRDVDRL